MACASPGLHQRVPDLDRAARPGSTARSRGRRCSRSARRRWRPGRSSTRGAGSSAGRRTTRRSRPRGRRARAGPGARARRSPRSPRRSSTSSRGGVLAQPAELRVGGGPAEALLVEPVDRPVVDDLAVLVAPRRVEDAADRQLRRVAGDHAVDQPQGVGPRDDVLVERRDVDQRGRLADRVVLDVVGVGVDARRVVARPLAPLQLAVERRGTRMEGGPDAHGLAVLLLRARSQYASGGSGKLLHQTYAGWIACLEGRSLAESYDAIVIGGGHNGLVSAAYLARAGMKTLVLERRHLLGGAAVTEEIFPGFRFSVFSYVVSLLRPEIIRDLQLPEARPRHPAARRHVHPAAARAAARPPAAATTCGGSTTTAGRFASCAAGRRATPRPTRNTAS